MKTSRPSPNGDNGGRNDSGRFAPGNRGGPGNPYARRVAQLRSTMLATVTDDDIRAIVAKLVEQAKSGDLAASKLVLDRCLGRELEPVDPDLVDVHEWENQRKHISAERDRQLGAMLGAF